MGKLRREETNGEEYLVASLEEGERVDEDSLAAVSGGQAPDGKGGIEGILPISYGQLMGERVLRYDINACMPFQEYKKQMKHKEELCRVFLSILDTYALADSYLLDPSCFLLEQEDIYVDRGTGKAWLLLYPVAGQAQVRRQDFAALFREMMRGVRLADEDMSFYGTLSYELDSMEVFNRTAFREFLLREGSKGAGKPGEDRGRPGGHGAPGTAPGAGAAGAGQHGGTGASGAWQSGRGGSSGAWQSGRGGASGAGQPVRGGTSGAGQSVRGGASGAGQSVGGGTSGAGQSVRGGTSGAGQSDRGGTSGAGQSVRGGMAGVGASVRGGASGVGQSGRAGAAFGGSAPGGFGAGVPDGEPPRPAANGDDKGFLGGLFGGRKEKDKEKEANRQVRAGKAEEKKAAKKEDRKAAKAEEKKAKKERRGKERAGGISLPDAEELPEDFLTGKKAENPVPSWAKAESPVPSWQQMGRNVPEIPQTVDEGFPIPPTDDELPARRALYLKHTGTGQVTEVARFPFEIGREGSGLVLDPDRTKVSRQHAVISRTEEGFTVRDVSKHGTFIDDMRIPKEEEVPLEDGMRILFKEVEFLVVIEDG